MTENHLSVCMGCTFFRLWPMDLIPYGPQPFLYIYAISFGNFFIHLLIFLRPLAKFLFYSQNLKMYLRMNYILFFLGVFLDIHF